MQLLCLLSLVIFPAIIFAHPIVSGVVEGTASWYNTGLGACGQTSNDEQMVVALPVALAGSSCFKTITLTNVARTPSPKIVATVMDKCMGCNGMDVDLSPAAFKALNAGDLSKGKIIIQWADRKSVV